MTLQASKLTKSNVGNQLAWNTTLDASDTTAKESRGVIREDFHPIFGPRKFKYVRFDVATTLGDLCSSRTPIDVANITSGSTTGLVTTGLTADIYVGGILRCYDDAGAAGAAPEGESGVIIDNTTTTITIDTNDAFSAAAAVNDDFKILLPWAVVAAAASDLSSVVAGVAMATQAQYSFGWVQFFGLHPAVKAIAAGTTITAGKCVIATTSAVTVGSTSTVEARIGYADVTLTTDTVLRTIGVRLFCGEAFPFGAST